MSEEYLTFFEEKRHPTIKVYEERVEAKGRDSLEFRIFPFQDIKHLKFYPPARTILGMVFPFLRKYSGFRISIMGMITGDYGPSEIWFYKKNGNSWSFNLPSSPNNNFIAFFDINGRCYSHFSRETNFLDKWMIYLKKLETVQFVKSI